MVGAMLPDFAGMVGVRVDGTANHETLQQGITLHHRTDDAFHGAPVFVELCKDAVNALTTEGVSRGSARAVGHVGSELLLDGWLASDDDARDVYRAALAAGTALLPHVSLRGDDAQGRFEYLLSRLSNAPIPERYAEADFVTERLAFILASRPRLALTPRDTQAVRHYLRHAQTKIHAVAPSLIEHVRAALSPT